MDDPVATCFRIAEIEHVGIVAHGSNKAPIGSWRKIAIALTTGAGCSANGRGARLSLISGSCLLGFGLGFAHALVRTEDDVGANVSRIRLRYFLAKRHHAQRLIGAVAHDLEPAFVRECG